MTVHEAVAKIKTLTRRNPFEPDATLTVYNDVVSMDAIWDDVLGTFSPRLMGAVIEKRTFGYVADMVGRKRQIPASKRWYGLKVKANGYLEQVELKYDLLNTEGIQIISLRYIGDEILVQFKGE